MVQQISEHLHASGYHSLGSENTKRVEWYYIVIPIIIGSLIIIAGITRWRKRRRQRNLRRQMPTVYVIPDIQTSQVPKPYVRSKPVATAPTYQRENSVYLVPYTALPLNFDFTSPKVQVNGDYVIIQDLSLLESQQVGSAIPIPGNLQEYQQQQPYNPTFYS